MSLPGFLAFKWLRIGDCFEAINVGLIGNNLPLACWDNRNISLKHVYIRVRVYRSVNTSEGLTWRISLGLGCNDVVLGLVV